MDAETGEIVATELTTDDVDDARQIGLLLDQMGGPMASFTRDGAYDQDSVYRAVMDRDPDTAVIVPPRSTAVPSETAETNRHFSPLPPSAIASPIYITPRFDTVSTRPTASKIGQFRTKAQPQARCQRRYPLPFATRRAPKLRQKGAADGLDRPGIPWG
jgi:hypothetical protein